MANSYFKRDRILATIAHPKHVNSMINSPNPNMRKLAAFSGENKHLDKLVEDKDPIVRLHVARYGHRKHFEHLVNDPNKKVADAAKDSLNALDREDDV